MQTLDPTEIHQAVAKIDGLSNVQRVYHFSATRACKDGSDEMVSIEIHDAGNDCDWGRYTVVARNEKGRGTSGNPFNTIEPALACVHWCKLDDPE